MDDFQLIRRVLPELEEKYKNNVFDLWRNSFGEEEVADVQDQFAGKECVWNEDIIYIALVRDQVAACCHITRRKGTVWAGLGGVVSSTAFRGCGAGKAVCNFALQDFDSACGGAVWLGTSNPLAANLYRDLGFSFVPGSHVMLRITGKKHPTLLYEELFSSKEFSIQQGTPAARIPFIPLCTQISSGLLKEVNANICNPNAITQVSCMGLFSRLQKICVKGGKWFMLETAVKSIGGLGSWMPLPDGRICVDAFCHDRYSSALPDLLKHILEQASAKGKNVFVPCSDSDIEKKNILLALGLHAGQADTVTPRAGLQIPVRDYFLP